MQRTHLCIAANLIAGCHWQNDHGDALQLFIITATFKVQATTLMLKNGGFPK